MISGYLITSIILREMRDGTFTLLGFYERRVRRIIPALVAVTVACLPFGALWLNPARLDYFAESVVAVMAFASNIYFWRDWGYFSEASALNPMLHTWSLAIEEQFYIVFPPAMILLWRLRRRVAFSILLGIALASFGLCVWLTDEAPSAAFFLTPSRAWELLVGVLLALYVDRHPVSAKTLTATLAGLAGLALILVPVAVFDERMTFPGIAALAPTLGTALLILYADRSNLVGRCLSAKPVVAIGLISYSAYLWHQPVFAFARIRGISIEAPAGQAAAIGLVLALAYLSWRFVETPFRDRTRTSPRQVRELLTVAFFVGIATGASGLFSDGFRWRYGSDVLAVAAKAEFSPRRADCHTDYHGQPDPGVACIYFGGDLRWGILGDSHAVEIAYALAEMLQERDQALLHLSHSDCPPAYTFTTKAGCHEWTRAAVARLIASPEIENVVLVYRHTGYLFGDLTDTYPEMPDRLSFKTALGDVDAAREQYWSSFLKMVERLRASGKRVYVVYPAPELGWSIADTIYPRSVLDRGPAARDRVGLSIREYAVRNAFVGERMSQLSWGDTLVAVDSADVLCQGGQCPAIRDGVPYYYDAHHLTLHAARIVARDMMERSGAD